MQSAGRSRTATPPTGKIVDWPKNAVTRLLPRHDSARNAARSDGANRYAIIVQIPQYHIFVAVVGVCCQTDLAPFPPEVRHDIRVVRNRNGVALANGLFGFPPHTRRDALRVIIDRPEIECRAIARKIAGIRNRVGAFTLHHRQTQHESVRRVCRMDVQIPKQYLARPLYTERSGIVELAPMQFIDGLARYGRCSWRARPEMPTVQPQRNSGHVYKKRENHDPDKPDHDTHKLLPLLSACTEATT
jgi:hypothetical protein